jgi:hypothetical protein
MNKIILIICGIVLTGCGHMITVQVDPTPISKEKSTLIVFHDQGINGEYPVFLDRKSLGKVTSEKPLKIEIESGKHMIYTSLPLNIIDEINEFTAEKGKVYFFNIRFEVGWWVSNIWTDTAYPITQYTVRSFK